VVFKRRSHVLPAQHQLVWEAVKSSPFLLPLSRAALQGCPRSLTECAKLAEQQDGDTSSGFKAASSGARSSLAVGT